MENWENENKYFFNLFFFERKPEEVQNIQVFRSCSGTRFILKARISWLFTGYNLCPYTSLTSLRVNVN